MTKNSIPGFLIAVMLLAACGGNGNKQADSADSLVTGNTDADGTLCFEHLDGTANQDTSKIRLEINGPEVSGTYHSIPYEKDSRRGTLKGTKEGDLIKATWTYMQEGTEDTLSVAFRLSDGKLLQQEYVVNGQTGRQELRDASPFSIEYYQVECNP